MRATASTRRTYFSFVVLVSSVALTTSAVTTAGAQAQDESGRMSDPVTPVAVVIDPDDHRPTGGDVRTHEEGEPLPTSPPPARDPQSDPVAQIGTDSDASIQSEASGIDALSDPVVNEPGTTSNARPPDTTGDVGPDHYIQMHNAGPTGGQTVYQIFDKDGNDASGGAIRFGGLWPAGDICNSDLGDPIVVYDHLADRWLLSQFANPTHMCIAISQTPDPTANSWFVYTFNTDVFNIGANAFPDYPKFGVWPDGYYMSTWESGTLGVFAFDRTQMLLGNAAGIFKDTRPGLGAAGVRATRILPSDLDGPAPPAGTPNYFVRTVDDQQDPGSDDRIEIYEFEVDWFAGTSSFSLVQTMTQASDGLAPFDIMTCNRNGLGTRDCIPQPDNTNTLDALSNRPMQQLKYRVLDGEEVMVFNQTIDTAGSINAVLGFTPANEVAGIRWYELHKPAAGWQLDQQGTYAAQPSDASTEAELLHRWMGSAAIDKAGNLALGYSIVNSDSTNGDEVYPGIRYTGRTFDDSPNVLPQGEKVILDGIEPQDGFTSGSSCVDNNGNPSGCRWGDYSALSVDPVDDCTFWYTNHVASQGGTGAKPTQIASFRFDTCGTDLAIDKTVEPPHPNAGEEIVYTITVTNNGTTDAGNVVVTDDLPPEAGYLADTDTCSGVAVGDSGTLTCELGTIAAGQSRSFEIKVAIEPDLGGATSITNTASVSSDTGETDASDNTVSLTHLVNEEADVRVTKLCKPDSGAAPAGTEGVCSMFVANDGPSAARNVQLEDTHVSDGPFELGTPSTTTGSCLVTGGDTVTCDLGKLQPGDTARVDVPVTSDEGVDVNDRAVVRSDTPDPVTSNNESTAGVTFEARSDLSITKTGPTEVIAGTSLTYMLEVTNGGPSTATGVVATDELPTGVSFVSASPTTGTVNESGGTVTWNVGTMGAGASETLEITVDVLPDTTGQLVNDAAVTSEVSDPDTSNNLAQWTTDVIAEAGLTVTKADSPDAVLAGDDLTYTITVGNTGPSTATDVVVTDLLPDEVTLVSAVDGTGAGVCAEVQPGEVVCEIGDLDPGDTVTIIITVSVDPSVPDGSTLTNTVMVSSPTDPDGAEAVETTTVNTEAELWIEKTGTATAGNPSGDLIYEITVHNVEGSAPDDTPTSGDGGPSDAQDVVVVDHLPLDPKKMEIQFLSPSCTYDEAAHEVTCTTATLPAGTAVTYEIQVKIKGSVGTITNTATVTSSTFDPDTSNNTDSVNNVVQGGTGKGKKPN